MKIGKVLVTLVLTVTMASTSALAQSTTSSSSSFSWNALVGAVEDFVDDLSVEDVCFIATMPPHFGLGAVIAREEIVEPVAFAYLMESVRREIRSRLLICELMEMDGSPETPRDEESEQIRQDVLDLTRVGF